MTPWLLISALAGAPVSTRVELDALLAGDRVDEGFEGLTLAPGASAWTSTDPVKHLDETTLFQGQGPGLVVPGIRLRSTNTDTSGENAWLQWNGDGYFGMQTQSLYADRQLEIDFLTPVTAFGLDLEDYPAFPITDVARVRVYGADDATLLYQVDLAVADEPGTFVGYRHAAGIGRVVLGTAVGDTSLSPQVDDLVFSFVDLPPEPEVSVTGTCPGATTLTLTHFTPGGRIRLLSSDGPGALAVPVGPCAGTISGLGSSHTQVRATLTADVAGAAAFQVTLPGGVCGRAVVQALDEATCTFSNVAGL